MSPKRILPPVAIVSIRRRLPLPAKSALQRSQNKGLETAWNGSGYFRQAMATLGVTTDDGRRTTDDTGQIIEFGDSLE